MVVALKNVLILSAGNSARSILAEALFNNLPLSLRKFVAYSAGSSPAGEVDPIALELLRESGLPTDNLRSKGLQGFSEPGAPSIDLVISICDPQSGEGCLGWNGEAADAQWHIRNPALVEGEQARRKAFKEVFAALRGRIDLMANLPVEKLDALSVHSHTGTQ